MIVRRDRSAPPPLRVWGLHSSRRKSTHDRPVSNRPRAFRAGDRRSDVDAAAIYELEPSEARKVLDDLQAAPIDKLPVDEEWITIPSDFGDARVRIVRPVDSPATLPVIVYMHGGGGSLATRARTIASCASSRSARTQRCSSSSTPTPRRPGIRWRSSRATPPRNGSSARAQATAWTPAAWPSPAIRSAATWPRR